MLNQDIAAPAGSAQQRCYRGVFHGIFHEALATIQADTGISNLAAFDVLVARATEWDLDVRDAAVRIVEQSRQPA
jgi:hypothetical protein